MSDADHFFAEQWEHMANRFQRDHCDQWKVAELLEQLKSPAIFGPVLK